MFAPRLAHCQSAAGSLPQTSLAWHTNPTFGAVEFLSQGLPPSQSQLERYLLIKCLEIPLKTAEHHSVNRHKHKTHFLFNTTLVGYMAVRTESVYLV